MWSEQGFVDFGRNFLCNLQWGVTHFTLWRFLQSSRLLQEYLGSGYTKTIVNYPIFDVPLLKRCLQKIESLVSGTLDFLSMTKFVVIRLKWAKDQDWMQSRQSLRMALDTDDLSLHGLTDVVSNIFGVWPLIVSYPKETGMKDSDDGFVECLFLVDSFFA